MENEVNKALIKLAEYILKLIIINTSENFIIFFI